MQTQSSSRGCQFNFGKYQVRIHYLTMLAAVMVVLLLCGLGVWQLHRAQRKQDMLDARAAQAEQSSRLLSAKIKKPAKYAHFMLEGEFNKDKLFLIDNRYYMHRLGYQVVQLFLLKDNKKTVLVDRGWISKPQYLRMQAKQSSAKINSKNKNKKKKNNTKKNKQAVSQANDDKQPKLHLSGEWLAKGIVYYPGSPFKLNNKIKKSTQWPKILPQYDLKLMREYLSSASYPFIIVLDKNQPASFKYNFSTVSISPARHRGYALQWFSFALIALVAFMSLSIKRRKAEDDSDKDANTEADKEDTK